MTDRETSAGRLVAVVVTHNRLAQLKVTLSRLLQSPPHDLQAVVVVDNTSRDGTEEWLAANDDPRLMVYRSEGNLGGAGGFAMGLRLATEHFDPDWILVMDDDARPMPGALAAFHALDLTAWDAVASAVYFPNGEICDMNRPSRNPFWHGREFLSTLRRGRSGFHLGPTDYATSRSRAVDVTSFVGFFVSRRAVEMAGYPDPDLFLYADDGLYTLGLSQAGGRIGFEPSVHFEHDCSTFGAAQRGRFRPLWKTYYYHRNLLMLYRLAAGWLFWPALFLIIPKWLFKTRAHSGAEGRFLRLILRAVCDGLLKRTNVPHERVLGWAGHDPET